MTDGSTLYMERTYQAPAEAVFDAWTSEEVLRRWFHGEPGWDTPEAEVDLRVGGRVRVVMRNPELDERHGGEGHYTVVEPPSRLSFTWVWDADEESRQTLIEIEFEQVGANSTTVRFTHANLPDEESVRSHEGGWSTAFSELEAALS